MNVKLRARNSVNRVRAESEKPGNPEEWIVIRKSQRKPRRVKKS